jgi:hypothetical protein
MDARALPLDEGALVFSDEFVVVVRVHRHGEMNVVEEKSVVCWICGLVYLLSWICKVFFSGNDPY